MSNPSDAALVARLRTLIEKWQESATAKMRWTNHPEAEPVFIHSADYRLAIGVCADELSALLDAGVLTETPDPPPGEDRR